MSLTIHTDLRAALGPARHQGRRPTCLSFAASDVHRHARQYPEWLCVEWLYFHVSQQAGTGPNDGTTLPDTRTVLRQIGQPEEPAWPYSPLPPRAAEWRPPSLSTVPLTCGSRDCNGSMSAIRRELDDSRPVVIGLFTSDTFNMPETWDRVGSEVILGQDQGHGVDRSRGHAVVVVGQGTYAGEVVLLLRNSWGTRWGHEGHAWVRERYLGPRLAGGFVISKGDVDVFQSDGYFADADTSPRLG